MDKDKVLAAAAEFAAHRAALRAQLHDQLRALADEEVRRIEEAAEALGPRSRGTVTRLSESFGRSRTFINDIIVNRWGPATQTATEVAVQAGELPATV